MEEEEEEEEEGGRRGSVKGEEILLVVFDVWRRTYNGEIDTRGEYIPYHTKYEGVKGHVVEYSTVLHYPRVVALADAGADADGRRTSESANTRWRWRGGVIGWTK